VACNLKPAEKFTISPNIVVESYEKNNPYDHRIGDCADKLQLDILGHRTVDG